MGMWVNSSRLRQLLGSQPTRWSYDARNVWSPADGGRKSLCWWAVELGDGQRESWRSFSPLARVWDTPYWRGQRGGREGRSREAERKERKGERRWWARETARFLPGRQPLAATPHLRTESRRMWVLAHVPNDQIRLILPKHIKGWPSRCPLPLLHRVPARKAYLIYKFI